MLTVFYSAFLVLFYIFIGYPVVLLILSMLVGKKILRKDIRPTVSLIISAYNEEKVIRRKLENTLELDYPKDRLEVIVASEASDKTNDIVKEYADRGIALHAYGHREGKPATLFKTVPLAKGEIIIFSDANALYWKDAILKLVRNFADPRVGCVSGRLTYVNPKESMVGGVESTYWEFEFFLKGLLSRMMALSGGINGSIFAIRKALYNPIDKYRGDDYEISNRIQMAGYGVVLESEALSFEEASATSKQEFKRKVRLATWNLRSTLILMKEGLIKWKWLTFFVIFSHRFLRYTTPVWVLMLFGSNLFLLNGLLFWFFLLQLLFYGTALAGFILENRKTKVKTLFQLPFYFCLVNGAALLALIKNLFRKTEILWEKTR